MNCYYILLASDSVLAAGLRYDDVHYEEHKPEVKEALRRLPKPLFYEREFRISRATQLSLQKDILPQKEWTDYDKVSLYILDEAAVVCIVMLLNLAMQTGAKRYLELSFHCLEY